MSNHWSFKYTPIPEGARRVTGGEWEKIALAKLDDPKADPEEALWAVIQMYCGTGRHPVGLGYMEKVVAAAVDPEKKAHCYLALGGIMEQVNDYKAAIGWYRRALGLEPTHSGTWYFINNNLGYCLNHFGKFTEAENYCRRAIALNGERYNAHKNLGISLQGQGLVGEAARCFVRAVQLEAADPRALRHLEDLLAENPGLATAQSDIFEDLLKCREAVRAVQEEREARLREG